MSDDATTTPKRSRDSISNTLIVAIGVSLVIPAAHNSRRRGAVRARRRHCVTVLIDKRKHDRTRIG